MKKTVSIAVDVTEGDIQDLKDGKSFDWVFVTNDGQEVAVHLFNSDLVENGE